MIHHNQLLLTKCWTNDVKSAACQKLLIQWLQKCSPLQIMNQWPRKPEDKVVLYLVSRKTEQNGEVPLRTRKYFEWIIKAIIEFDFPRIWRILQISEGVIRRGQRPSWITPFLFCRILHILLSLIIAKCIRWNCSFKWKRQFNHNIAFHWLLITC